MKDIKKDYVVFVTRVDKDEDSYVTMEKKPLSEVSNLVAGDTKPVNSGDGFADYSLIEMRLKGLAGRILTIVDAAIPPGKQNKSVKDLIRGKLMDEYQFYGEMLFDQEALCKRATESFEEGTMTQVSEEDILGS